MLDITAIILTYNEEMHIRRCLENVKQFAKRIIVVDCFSKDKTCEIAKEMGAEVIQHEWPGNQAEQFNWLIDNVSINTKWILRLDADEYLMPDLIAELNEKLPIMDEGVSALSLSLARAYCGKIFIMVCEWYQNRENLYEQVRLVMTSVSWMSISQSWMVKPSK